MLPTPNVPAPVQALRVIVWLQVGLRMIGAALGLGVAVLSSPSLDDGDEAGSWAAAFVVFGLSFAAICVVVAVLLAIPALLLRGSRPGSKVGALGVTCAVQALFGLFALIVAVAAAANTGIASAFAPLLGAAIAATVVVLGTQPSSRRWAAQT